MNPSIISSTVTHGTGIYYPITHCWLPPASFIFLDLASSIRLFSWSFIQSSLKLHPHSSCVLKIDRESQNYLMDRQKFRLGQALFGSQLDVYNGTFHQNKLKQNDEVLNSTSPAKSSWRGFTFGPLATSVSHCEGQKNNAGETPLYRQRPSPDNPYKEEIKQLQKELDEPCKTCMYTGMAVCTALSLYFARLAIDDTTLAKNRRFLWACSAGSLVAGGYRWHLGWNDAALRKCAIQRTGF
jgi:hypothetical protein